MIQGFVTAVSRERRTPRPISTEALERTAEGGPASEAGESRRAAGTALKCLSRDVGANGVDISASRPRHVCALGASLLQRMAAGAGLRARTTHLRWTQRMRLEACQALLRLAKCNCLVVPGAEAVRVIDILTERHDETLVVTRRVFRGFGVEKSSAVAQALNGFHEKLMTLEIVAFRALVAINMLAGRVSRPRVQMAPIENNDKDAPLAVKTLRKARNRKPERDKAREGLRLDFMGGMELETVAFQYGAEGALAHMRQSVGITLQDNFWFRGAVRENIARARPGSGEFIDRPPPGNAPAFSSSMKPPARSSPRHR